ncbi:MAG TPA: PEGA domain-containing protein [Polyangiaceae bacterium]|nr:PEGA domain-containing protein [Polyangiaceae bacterium]
MSARSRACARWLWLCALLAPCWARADEPDVTRERAEASFRAGAAAYAAGEYLAAIQALDAAYTLTPLPAIAFSLAQAERRHYFASHEPEHLARAITLYRSYVSQVQVGGRRADALEALSQLEPLAAVQERGASTAESQKASAPTRLLVMCDAPGAQVSLDGGPKQGSPLVREVEPGKHRASAEAPGFFPAERELTALKGELILGELSLRERPSLLLLATPPDADVYIDGTFATQGGARVKLELPAGEHRLTLTAKGARIETRRVLLSRGKEHWLRIKLTRTPQRAAARALFGIGGAALGASVVLAGLAVQTEGRAQRFLTDRRAGNVTSDELADYHRHVRARDSYQGWSIVSAGIAGALFIAGVLLRELDRPNQRDIQREARSVARAPRLQRKVLAALPRVSPFAHATGAGAALQHFF